MPDQVYNWKRFWYPRGETIKLGNDGYLFDPDAPYGEILNAKAVPFAKIASIPCLGLLAEPGMGKTLTMRLEQREIDAAIKNQGEQTLWLNLRSYGSEDRLVRKLFQSQKIDDWHKGSHRLHIFLDSLDEGLLGIATLASLLIDELQSQPVDRLSLRIACRTAEWPAMLEQGLLELWGKEAVAVYKLAPLRRVDVTEAAKNNGIDPETFLRQIDQNRATPFAIKPVTLNFLLNTFQRAEQLPRTQAKLYLEGCFRLVEEVSDSRRAAGRFGAFSPDQRLHIAGLVAAVTVFANRDSIWIGRDEGNVPREDVTLRDLLINTSRSNNSLLTEAALHETLDTGLFSARGQNRVGWAHQTYAEFLAAWYLSEQQMNHDQMMSLLLHPEDAAGKLVPQLHETAAWIAGMNADVFRSIVRIEPYILLRSDIATTSEEDREVLVSNLLNQFETEQLTDIDPGLYRKLTHPKLAEQLLPYLQDQSKSRFARYAAIALAEECELHDIQQDLAAIALDSTEATQLRIRAAYAVSYLGDEDTKATLKPLARGEAGEDDKDELKGCALRMLWPNHMTATELFSVLTPAKTGSFIGAYDLFISKGFTQHLQPADLPIALEWITTLPSRHELSLAFEEPINEIFLQAWKCLEQPEILPAFAKAALSRLKHHEAIVQLEMNDSNKATSFRFWLREDDKKRRQLLEAILLLFSNLDEEWRFLVSSRTALVMSEDVPWLIERIQATVSEHVRVQLSRLIGRVFDWSDPAQLEIAFTASQNNALLAKVFSRFFTPVPLDSPEAQEFKTAYYEQQQWQEQSKKREMIEPPPTEQAAQLLAKFESGDLDAWWYLNLELTLELDSTHYGDESEADLRVLPGWQAADEEMRDRIIAAAERFICEADPQTQEWLGTDIHYRPAWAGYRALYLLQICTPKFVAQLPPAVWKTWAPMIYRYPVESTPIINQVHTELVRLAYHHAPEEVINSLLIDIDQQNKEHSTIAIPSKIKSCWDAKLVRALLNKAQDESLSPASLEQLLNELLYRNVEDAKVYTAGFLTQPLPIEGTAREKAIRACYLLITYGAASTWSIIWEALQVDTEFSQAVIARAAHSGDRFANRVAQHLTERQLADLYIWLVYQYPPNEDPQHEERGFHTITPRESIAQWRDSILRHLTQRGTQQACLEIQRIISVFPEFNWLKRTLLEAQAITRRHTWIAPSPQHVIQLTQDKHAHLVERGEQPMSHIVPKDGYNKPSIRIFYSYAHKDERLRNHLEAHLKILQHQGLVEMWHDRKIEAGSEWKQDIDENLERADIILLLISANFINSDYCYSKEMTRALERHEQGIARVIPIIVRDVNWQLAPFAKLQALPKDGKAVMLWANKDSAWRNISEGIQRAVEEMQSKR